MIYVLSWVRLAKLLCFALAVTPARAELKGSPQAIAMAEAIVLSAGGHDAWKDLRYLHANIKGYRTEAPFEVQEDLWTEFPAPYTYFSMIGEDFEISRAITPNSGWSSRNGRVTALSASDLKAFQDFWAHSEHVLYYRMAVRDPALKVVKANANRLEFYDATSNKPLGWFDVNGKYEPVRWVAPFQNTTVEYVFGPFKQFGAVRLPKWGAAPNGDWRFENVDISTGVDAPPISYSPNRK